eukprot:10584737-Ditylum_brightwellii.AAC.1
MVKDKNFEVVFNQDVYYMPLILWVVLGFVESFTGEMRDKWGDISGSDEVAYFYDKVIGMKLIWAIIDSCAAFDIKWTGKA